MSVEIRVELPWNENWTERSATKRIILHHLAAEHATVQDIEKWHRIDFGWSGGFGYHFYIRKDGTIYQGRPIKMMGSHVKGFNSDSIGIAFEGNFEYEEMPEIQVQAGIELIRYIFGKYGTLKIQKHKDVNNDTECPGMNFDGRLLKVNLEPRKGVDYIMYKDENKISDFAKQAVKELNEKGIMVGDSDDNFRPKDNLTREEAAVLVYKALKSLGA